MSEASVAKRDCISYMMCLYDVDWRPKHCEDCKQYKKDKFLGKSDEQIFNLGYKKGFGKALSMSIAFLRKNKVFSRENEEVFKEFVLRDKERKG